MRTAQSTERVASRPENPVGPSANQLVGEQPVGLAESPLGNYRADAQRGCGAAAADATGTSSSATPPSLIACRVSSSLQLDRHLEASSSGPASGRQSRATSVAGSVVGGAAPQQQRRRCLYACHSCGLSIGCVRPKWRCKYCRVVTCGFCTILEGGIGPWCGECTLPLRLPPAEPGAAQLGASVALAPGYFAAAVPGGPVRVPPGNSACYMCGATYGFFTWKTVCEDCCRITCNSACSTRVKVRTAPGPGASRGGAAFSHHGHADGSPAGGKFRKADLCKYCALCRENGVVRLPYWEEEEEESRRSGLAAVSPTSPSPAAHRSAQQTPSPQRGASAAPAASGAAATTSSGSPYVPRAALSLSPPRQRPGGRTPQELAPSRTSLAPPPAVPAFMPTASDHQLALAAAPFLATSAATPLAARAREAGVDVPPPPAAGEPSPSSSNERRSSTASSSATDRSGQQGACVQKPPSSTSAPGDGGAAVSPSLPMFPWSPKLTPCPLFLQGHLIVAQPQSERAGSSTCDAADGSATPQAVAPTPWLRRLAERHYGDPDALFRQSSAFDDGDSGACWQRSDHAGESFTGVKSNPSFGAPQGSAVGPAGRVLVELPVPTVRTAASTERAPVETSAKKS